MIEVRLSNEGEREVIGFDGRVIGWLEDGRRMIDSRGSWTEWRFVPSNDAPAGEIRRTYNEAREDARHHARALM